MIGAGGVQDMAGLCASRPMPAPLSPAATGGAACVRFPANARLVSTPSTVENVMSRFVNSLLVAGAVCWIACPIATAASPIGPDGHPVLAHTDTLPRNEGLGTGGSHGLVRTAVLSGDYSDFPPQPSGQGPEFGFSVAMDGEWLAVGAPSAHTRQDEPDRVMGVVFVFRWLGDGWALVQRLTTSSNGSAPRCGYSVAMRLPNLVVGCPGSDWPDSGEVGHGRVIFYRLDQGDSWSSAGTAYFPAAGSACGTQVDVSATGASGSAVAAIGCPGWNGETGRVWTRRFEGSTGNWSTDWLTVNASDGATGDRFGSSLAVYRSEVLGVSTQRLAVAAPAKPIWPAILAGKVYAFGGPAWTETQTFTHPAPDTFGLVLFGTGLAMNNNQLVIGSPGGLTFDCPNAPRCGLVQRYERQGGNWQLAEGGGAINLGGNPAGEQVGMGFGSTVALGFDNLVAIAAPRTDGWRQPNGLAEEVGMVELRRGESGTWGVSWPDHLGEIGPAPIGALAFDQGHFGTSLSFGGRRLAVGYPHTGGLITGRRGQVWIYSEDLIFADDFEP